MSRANMVPGDAYCCSIKVIARYGIRMRLPLIRPMDLRPPVEWRLAEETIDDILTLLEELDRVSTYAAGMPKLGRQLVQLAYNASAATPRTLLNSCATWFTCATGSTLLIRREALISAVRANTVCIREPGTPALCAPSGVRKPI